MVSEILSKNLINYHIVINIGQDLVGAKHYIGFVNALPRSLI